jgi:hypothetical protein
MNRERFDEPTTRGVICPVTERRRVFKFGGCAKSYMRVYCPPKIDRALRQGQKSAVRRGHKNHGLLLRWPGRCPVGAMERKTSVDTKHGKESTLLPRRKERK